MPFTYRSLKIHNHTLLLIYELLFKHFGPQHWWPAEDPLEIIIGAILTQNTSWRNVEKAIFALKSKGYLSSDILFYLDEKELASLIISCGYYNIKAKRLKNFITFFTSHYNGCMNNMFSEDLYLLREKLLKVKGLGPETTDSILLYAGNKPIFVIDAYTKRIFSRHNFIEETDNYHQVQELFMKNLPHDPQLFNEYHALIVTLAKNYCRKKATCKGCPLREFSIKRHTLLKN